MYIVLNPLSTGFFHCFSTPLVESILMTIFACPFSFHPASPKVVLNVVLLDYSTPADGAWRNRTNVIKEHDSISPSIHIMAIWI